MTSRDSNEYSTAASFSAAADGGNAWLKTERGQGDAGDSKQTSTNKPSRDSGMSGQGQRDSELGQGDNVLGRGDAASPRLDAAVIQTLIAPIKQQFTEELAQRDARIQNLERKVDRLAVADRELAASSSLNVQACEFVPKGNFQVAPVPTNDTVSALEPMDPLDEMLQSINYLTTRPGHFDLIMEPLIDSLSLSLGDESTMLDIIEMILTQAISEANFRYTGARMCNFLSQNLRTAFGAGNFRQQLLKRCHDEFKKSMEVMESEDVGEEVIGFTLFLAELLSNVMDSINERLKIVANALQDLLTGLLGHSSDTRLRCVVQVLKLSGGILYDIESEQTGGATPKLDAIFDLVKQVVVDSKCSRNLMTMLMSVIELRACDWGREPDESPSSVAQTSNVNPYSDAEEPLYNTGLMPTDGYPEWYAGDTDPLDGLEEMSDGVFVYDDEDEDDYESEAHGMDDEMTDAYEQFMQQQQKRLQ